MKKLLQSLALVCFGMAGANAQTIISQNFTGATVPNMPTGWTATNVGAGNGWQTTNVPTNLYFNTVPTDALHSQYAVVNDYGQTGNDPATMTSPSFSLTSSTTPYLAYDYYFFSAYTTSTPAAYEKAWVDISSDGGTNWTTIDSIPGFTSQTQSWTTRTVSLASYTSSSTCKVRFVYTDNGGELIGVAVGDIYVMNQTTSDLILGGATPVAGSPSDYYSAGASANLGGTVINHGSSTVSSFSVSYTVDGGSVVTGNITGVSIPAFGTYAFTAPTPYTVGAIGMHNIKMWVTLAGDIDHTNDTANTSLQSISFIPTKKLCVEEATGTWCGWCVRGIVYMDSLRDLYGSALSQIAVHDQDPMSEFSSNTTAYDTYISGMISGYPSVIIDRTLVDDPGNLLDDYTAHASDFGYANITFGTPSTTSTTLSLPVTVAPAVDINGAKLALVVTEDNVHNGSNSADGGEWEQHNYYSTQSQNQALTGQGWNYQDSADVINASSMYYQFVARGIYPSNGGGSGLLPASMTAGSTYNYTFSNISIAGVNRNYMKAVVMLIDGTTGAVMNTQNVAFTLGVPNVAAGVDNVIIFPNPAPTQATVQFNLDHTSTVQVTVIDMAGRTVYTVAGTQMVSGTNKIVIPTGNLAQGSYNVNIQTDNGVATERLSVVR